MRKLVDSGAVFLIVALICFVAGVAAEKSAAFIGIGGFWVIMAVIVRSKNAKGKSEGGDNSSV